MTNLLTIPHKLDRAALTCRAIIETSKGQRSKFDYDEETGLFALANVLPAGLAFPLSFGFIPSTMAEDGDPADILVLADEDLPIGALVTVRLLGLIEAEQTEDGNSVRNDRWVGKVAQSRRYADINELDDLGAGFINELERFFVTYNDLKGNSFDVRAVHGAARACQMIGDVER